VQTWPDAISSWALLKLLTFAFPSLLQNNPLYLHSFTEADDALKLHHIVHCSLDVIDERGSYASLSRRHAPLPFCRPAL
jgi:hypothetical protein